MKRIGTLLVGLTLATQVGCAGIKIDSKIDAKLPSVGNEGGAKNEAKGKAGATQTTAAEQPAAPRAPERRSGGEAKGEDGPDYAKMSEAEVAKIKVKLVFGELHEPTVTEKNGRHVKGSVKSYFDKGWREQAFDRRWRSIMDAKYPDWEKSRCQKVAADVTDPKMGEVRCDGELRHVLYRLDTVEAALAAINDAAFTKETRARFLKTAGQYDTYGDFSVSNYPGWLHLNLKDDRPMKEWRRPVLRALIGFAKQNQLDATELEGALAATPQYRCRWDPWVFQRDHLGGGNFDAKLHASRGVRPLYKNESYRAGGEVACSAVPKASQDADALRAAKGEWKRPDDVLATELLPREDWEVYRNDLGIVMGKERVEKVYVREEF
ncbi:MAG: hypothetical protein JNL38_03335 [Myxococcales bacterium]|nr:hypothetical protein [Myxococcales bacterium]